MGSQPIDETFYRAPGAPMNHEEDYIVHATAFEGKVRALAIRSTQLCKDALRVHKTSPVATAALGRFLTGSLFLADSLKGDQDTQTTNIRCKGPIQGMTAVCEGKGNVRGYVNEPIVENAYLRPGKLDVGSAVGKGILTVIRDYGLKEPYVGSVELISGEIAEDFTYYLAVSEQTPSVMSLGVLLEDGTVSHAGGFLIQVMPGAEDELLSYLEARAGGNFPDVTFLLKEGLSPEHILDMFLGDPNIVYLSASPIRYHCNCSRDRMERNLITLGEKELRDLSKDEEGIHLACHFCDKTYTFSREEMTRLADGVSSQA